MIFRNISRIYKTLNPCITLQLLYRLSQEKCDKRIALCHQFELSRSFNRLRAFDLNEISEFHNSWTNKPNYIRFSRLDTIHYRLSSIFVKSNKSDPDWKAVMNSDKNAKFHLKVHNLLNYEISLMRECLLNTLSNGAK